MAFGLILLSLVILNLVYHLGWVVWALLWNIHNDHYFFGFNPRLFGISIFGVKLSFGIYIPIIGLARIYKVEGSEKTRVDLAWEFFDHPVWKRAVVALGGVVSLMLMGILCYIAVTFLEKDYFISKDTVNKYGIEPSEAALQYGFRSGDHIIKFNDNDYERLSELFDTNEKAVYTIARDNEELAITVDPEAVSSSYPPFFNLRIPPIIREVQPSSPADIAGLMKGDRFIKVNDHEVTSLDDLNKIRSYDTLGKLDILIRRDTLILNKTLYLNGPGPMGFIPVSPEMSIYERTIGESVIEGAGRAFKVIDLNVKAFTSLFSGEIAVTKPVSGPIGIAQVYGGFQWLRFWKITGMLAMLTAFFNLLPFPRATFWQTIPLSYEAITKERFRRSTYDKLIRISYFVVILLMVWIIMGDVIMTL